MPMAATAATAPLFLRSLPSVAPIAPLSLPSLSARRPAAIVLPFRVRYRVTCQAVLSADISSSSEIEEEEQRAAAKIGKRVRVSVPLKVCHVQKAPDLDLEGLEGVIKQYVGIWKGKRISSNLPFKVEFQIEVEGQTRPVKFISHLKEDEFQYLD
ncbi:ferredoxin-thioredoxin reductase, variable chain-like [Curcuma longa]|uniref:ferredoxin-thioredoxin reductase, variable chain-like n=1 Tax=Curcuma longa TaxID=136217 RepID=UPI003D9DE78D